MLVHETTGDEEKLLNAQIKLQRYRQEYTRFSRAAGLRTEDERLMVSGFGRGQAARARVAAKKVMDFDAEHLARAEAELLPNYRAAKIPDSKISGYSLNMDHPTGRDKAIAFEKALGYTVANKRQLLYQVRRGLKRYRATERPVTEYGTPFDVPMMIEGANGRFAKIRTGWIVDTGKAEPRLTSIYVDE